MLGIDVKIYIIALIASFSIAVVFSILVRKVALKFNIVDDPAVDPEKKKHENPIPFLGGVAICLSFILVLGFFYLSGVFDHTTILPKHVLGIITAVLLLCVSGALDDKYSLTPIKQLILPVLAVFIIIGSGIGVDFITNPLGGLLRLDIFQVDLFEWQGIPYRLFLLADLFTFAWFMGLMYSIKIFDGLDGLVSGISIIAGLVLYFLSIAINLPGVALIALIFVGAQFGFLLFNFNPATIFLGEAGALFSGFMLAVLAVLGSGKVATTFLVLGIPLLDMCWVVFRRIFIEKKSPAKGDRKHLHHRFLDAGFTQKQAVLFMYLISASFGISALFLQSMGKLIAICVLVVCMALMGLLLFLRFKSIKKI